MSIEINLNYRIALVTGASGDLGRCMALSLAQCGADVALHYHSREERLLPVLEAIQDLGRRAILVKGDISQQSDVQDMYQECSAELSPPDILVLNAVSQVDPWEHLLDESPDDYLDQFNSCVMQAVHLCQAGLPHMRQQGWGRIIGISTECIMQLYEKQSAYVSGKRALDGVLRVLSQEEARHGITVNQVAPGWIQVEDGRHSSADDSHYLSKVPMQRRGTPQDIANMVSYLASDLASFITGTWIPVSGGTVMPRV